MKNLILTTAILASGALLNGCVNVEPNSSYSSSRSSIYNSSNNYQRYENISHNSNVISEYHDESTGDFRFDSYHDNGQYDRPNTRQSNKTMIHTIYSQCLDLGQEIGKEIIRYDCHGKDNQRFSFYHDGTIRIQGKCLDAAQNSYSSGSPVIAYACHGQSNQQWYFDGDSIRNRASGKCLDVSKNGKHATMQNCDGSEGQQFWIDR